MCIKAEDLELADDNSGQEPMFEEVPAAPVQNPLTLAGNTAVRRALIAQHFE